MLYFMDRDVILSDGALNSAGSWDIWMGWVATPCHTLKSISLGVQLKSGSMTTKLILPCSLEAADTRLHGPVYNPHISKIPLNICIVH